MADKQTSAEAVLRIFHEAGPRDPGDAITFDTILTALRPHYSKGTVSARLSELAKAGILRSDERGKYRLAYADLPVPAPLQTLVGILKGQLPPRTLHGTVVWDATPHLATLEDGVMADIHVVETSRFTAGGTARMLLDAWPGEDAPHVQEFGDRGLLIEAVMGRAELNLRAGQPRVLVGPSEGHYTGTVLLREGVRMTSAERFLADLLGTQDPSASDSAWLALVQDTIEPARLFAVATERGLTPQLYVILAGLLHEVPSTLREAFLERVQEPARTILESHTP